MPLLELLFFQKIICKTGVYCFPYIKPEKLITESCGKHMKRKYYFINIIALFATIIFVAPPLFAQNKHTISGTVKDKGNGESLAGASVKILNMDGGTLTNSYGFFSLTLPESNYILIVSYVGYQTFSEKINLNKDVPITVELTVSGTLDEIVIKADKKNDNITKPLMGMEKLDIKMINQLPVIFGEKDILKSIQLLPGIKSAGEGNSGFYVRGGSADQNLILLDEAPVYNASHLFGGLGLISSRLNVQGPIVKDKGSFIISGRRSYADLFLKLSSDSALNNNTLYFYDLNLKANYKLGQKDKIYLSGYFGRDVLAFGETFASDWGNKTGTLRWNHVLNNKLFSNTSLIYSDYSYKIKINSGTDKFVITSQIQDVNAKQDFDFFLNKNNKIKFGANVIRHNVSPGRIDAEGSSNLKSSVVQKRYSWESALYVSHEVTLNKKLNMVYGLRLSDLKVIGPGNYFNYDSEGYTIDTISYKRGQKVVDYWNLEPRWSAGYQFTESKSIKASYNRNVQNLHLISNSTTSSPTDLWLPSSNNIKPEIADQVALGYYENFKDNQYEFSTEIYYKWLQNQIDYRNGAILRANDQIESELLYGKGRAYGIELFFKKRFGRFNGWIGYTLSKTERKFDQINEGKYFNARQDRTHDVSVVGIYKLNDRWSFSGTFVYSTGNAVTFPSGKYGVNNQIVFLYTERNAHRMPAYHRMDISATLENKHNKTRKFQSSWNFGIYNVYGRENAYSITFKNDPEDPSRTVAEQISLFKFIPGITWNFKF